jgi:Holliday junction resolvase-like predicted endonuclease
MLDLEETRKEILSGKSIEDVMERFDWRGFESNIAQIFSENDFVVRKNFRFKTTRRYEIDVVAVRGENVFCVDCKEWSRGRNKTSAIRQAASKQASRTKSLEKFLERNNIARSMVKIVECAEFTPVVVTLYEENVTKHGDTFVVPSAKLNSFLIDFEKFL